MKTVTKIGIGLIVTYSVVNTVLKACDRIESAFQTVVKEKQEEAVEKTVEWTKVYKNNGNIVECTDNQIKEYNHDKKGD